MALIDSLSSCRDGTQQGASRKRGRVRGVPSRERGRTTRHLKGERTWKWGGGAQGKALHGREGKGARGGTQQGAHIEAPQGREATGAPPLEIVRLKRDR